MHIKVLSCHRDSLFIMNIHPSSGTIWMWWKSRCARSLAPRQCQTASWGDRAKDDLRCSSMYTCACVVNAPVCGWCVCAWLCMCVDSVCMYLFVCVFVVCVCVCMCMYLCVCMCMYLCVCMCMYLCVVYLCGGGGVCVCACICVVCVYSIYVACLLSLNGWCTILSNVYQYLIYSLVKVQSKKKQ